MYRYLPDAEIRWADVWLGAVVAGLLLALGQWFLGMYLARSNVTSMFGAAGSLALILTWVYFCGLVFLFGAEFTQVWAHRHRRQ
jgi:membrane protein